MDSFGCFKPLLLTLQAGTKFLCQKKLALPSQTTEQSQSPVDTEGFASMPNICHVAVI